MEEEKFGKMVIDGKIVDLDNVSTEELDKYVKLLKKHEDEIENEIEEMLDR